MENRSNSQQNINLILPILFFFGRIILCLTMLPDNLSAFSDLNTYYQWADMHGWLYFDAWSEYPPLFPFINKLVFLCSKGNYYLFQFLLVILFSLAGAAVIYVHGLLAQRLYGRKEGFVRNLIFFGLLTPLAYTWWYFDLIPVLFMLMGLWYMMENKTIRSGIAIGLGILTKWFPVFALVAAWRCLPKKKALQIILIAVGLTVLVFGTLLIASPEMTIASLKAQFGRNSYLTAWALIDDNLTTGSVFLVEEQAIPEYANYRRGNLPVIPTWITLLLFGGLGLISIYKVKTKNKQNLISVLGITWAFFLLWCPGWSPQWILYLLPLISLSFRWNKSTTLAFCLTLLTIFEWPTLLARDIYSVLWIIVLLRIVLLVILIIAWVKALHQPESINTEKNTEILDLFG